MNLFVDQFICLMKQDDYTLCNAAICNGPSDLRQQFEDISQLGYLTGEYPQHQMFSPCGAKSVVINQCRDIGCAFQKRLPDVHVNVLQQGSQQWVLTEQSPSLASAEAFYFLNPSHPGEQHYNRSRPRSDVTICIWSVLNGSGTLLYVQPSQEVHMDRYFQCRHDIPWFSERCAKNRSTGSYDQRHQIPTRAWKPSCSPREE